MCLDRLRERERETIAHTTYFNGVVSYFGVRETGQQFLFVCLFAIMAISRPVLYCALSIVKQPTPLV